MTDIIPFTFINEDKVKTQLKERLWYPFYVGIDIGADFHVASCIQMEAFRDGTWKRQKTMKFNSDSFGISDFMSALKHLQRQFGLKPEDFFMLLEPTGGHYSFLLQRILLDEGYSLFQVENKAVKEFRENTLGNKEKSDAIDARVMSYMGWHKTLHPDMKNVRIVKPASITQSIFRTLMRDRWLLTTQLTRRKNQVQQLLQVTHPDIKRAFKKPGNITVLKLIKEYPTALDMKKASEEELYRTIIKTGAKTVAKKASKVLYEVLPNTVALHVPHMVGRQNWLIEEAIRIEESRNQVDEYIHSLLHGDPKQGIDAHPYTELLFSFPTMSDGWACTLIGTIGDADRFSTYKEFKKYLGVSAENKQSGTSVKGTHQTYSGTRDTRRILFQMSLTLISGVKPSVFKVYYDRLVERGMPKRKAIGHLCGKIAKLLYAMLKYNQKYDPIKHASDCGVVWNDLIGQKVATDPDLFLEEAEELAGISNTDTSIDEE